MSKRLGGIIGCKDKTLSLHLLLFLIFSVLVAHPKNLLYTVANPARGLLNREKGKKEKVWQHTPPTLLTEYLIRTTKVLNIDVCRLYVLSSSVQFSIYILLKVGGFLVNMIST